MNQGEHLEALTAACPDCHLQALQGLVHQRHAFFQIDCLVRETIRSGTGTGAIGLAVRTLRTSGCDFITTNLARCQTHQVALFWAESKTKVATACGPRSLPASAIS